MAVPGVLDPVDGALRGRAGRNLDCVVIGVAVTQPMSARPLFEAVLNAVGRQSPTPRIALTARPELAGEGVDRVMR